MNLYVLIIPILVPVLCGIGVMIFPIKDKRIRNILIETVVLINTVITLFILTHAPEGTLYLFSLGDKLLMTLRVDGLATFFAVIVSCLWPLATLYAFEYMEHDEKTDVFFGFYTITYGVTLGVAFSGNIVTMYLFYEALTMVTLPLVIHTMTKEAKRATRKYLYYMIGGTAFAFIGMVFYVLFSGGIEFVYGGNLNVSALSGYRDVIYFVYLLAFFGFGVKAAIFPFHGWLPEASVAPTPVTALLHAVAVVKSGVFAIMRFTYYCFGAQVLRGSWAQTVALVFAMLTIVHASTMGVRETHFKRRMAYSTVSNLSYILLGVTMMSPLGLLAAMAHMLFHAVMKISGFFCVGAVMHRADKNYVYELDGIGLQMPKTMSAFLMSSCSIVGIPLFAGFVSKWKIAQALFDSEMTLSYVAVFALLYSALMTAIYLLSVAVRAFFPDKDFAGKMQQPENKASDPTWRMLFPLGVLSIAVVIAGVWAEPVLSLLKVVAEGIF